MVGAPKLFSSTALPAFDPVLLDGLAEDIHAPEHALACVVAESDSFAAIVCDLQSIGFNHALTSSSLITRALGLQRDFSAAVLPKRILSPILDARDDWPSSRILPLPTD